MSEKVPGQDAPAPKIDKELDLKGEFCPYTFVKSKLALEDIEVGQVLRVVGDNTVSMEDIPHAMKDEGQAVLKVEKINDTDWEILVRRVA